MTGFIIKATVQDIPLLSEIATVSFIESHGSSAEAKDINSYVAEKYGVTAFREELSEEKNIYHIIYHYGQAAGYSKIVFDTPFSDCMIKNVVKLERLYLLKKFYDLKLGAVLFQFIVDLSKKNNQAGIWLYTWKENHRAINFYKKHGFEIIGNFDFAISATHSNPNHQMFLKF